MNDWHLPKALWRTIAALVILAATLALPAAEGIAGASSRPNIVFVLTDDLSANLVTPQFMPNLSALIGEGRSFSNYFDTDSLCCPSRASIFTGRLPHDTGVLGNGGVNGGYGAFERHGDEHSTFATDLDAAGYRTAMMGKYLNHYKTSEAPAPGWDEWDVADWGYPEFNYDLNEDGRLVHYGGPNVSGTDNNLTDVISRLGDAFVTSSVRSDPAQPFFLELASFAPHEPYTPAPAYAHLYPDLTYPETPAFDAPNVNPPRWLGQRAPLTAAQRATIDTDFRKRAEDVKSVDDMIGSLVDTLRSEGVLSNTYFVFSSDNGLHMGEHRLAPGKLTAFDTDIHVPLIVVGPGVPPGTTSAAFTENVDLRSTFDALAGTKPSEGVDGRDLAPVLFGSGAPPAGWPEGVVIEHHGPKFTPDDPDKPPPYSGNPPTYAALRLPHALYVEYLDGEREYYNLSADPFELDNIVSSLAPAHLNALHEELHALEHCRDHPACTDVLPPAESARRIAGVQAAKAAGAARQRAASASRAARHLHGW